MSTSHDSLIHQLARHEGFRGTPYRDTVGRLTVMYGRNLDARPFDPAEGLLILERDVDRYIEQLEEAWPQIKELDPIRRAACINMAYQLGVNGFMRFRRMRTVLEAGNWTRAAHEALDSKWAKQVPKRAREIAYQIETGRWLEYA